LLYAAGRFPATIYPSRPTTFHLTEWSGVDLTSNSPFDSN